MIAISSHRPHSRSAEFARNQALAKRTWEGVFRKIIYAGPAEPELDSDKTEFVYTEDFPTIQTLAKMAAAQSDITAILNADICISPRFCNVEHRMRVTPLLCASSRRYHFAPYPKPNFDMALLDEKDRGRDIFMAKQSLWKRVAEQVPSHLRIGHQQWDAWMSDFFRSQGVRWTDFTKERCVFHPKHGDRQMPYAQQIVEGKSA